MAKDNNKKDEPKVTRIKAKDTGEKKPKSTAAAKSSEKTSATAKTKQPNAGKKKHADTGKKIDSTKQFELEKKAVISGELKNNKNPIKAIGRYLQGSWHELRQVRWPNRRTTWALTLAVLLFTAFFFLLIIGLDTLFQFIFEQILG